MTQDFATRNPERFEAALRRFDEENLRDPNLETSGGSARPREWLYARWLSEWVLKLCPAASEELRLAARCQHLCRWMVPRNSQPMTRAGYLQWREGLRRFHAQKAGEILREVGYPDDIIARVQALNLKKNFPKDPEAQAMEDSLCLVFLEHQFEDLSNKSSEEKMVGALQKCWKKMSPPARTLAQTLPYKDREKALLEKALKA